MLFRTGSAGLLIPGVEVVQAGSESFAGAYDAIPSIAAAYGMRRLRSAYTGNLLKLRRASDNAELDFGYLANGDLNVADIATFIAATTGLITTWYDQSGNGNNIVQTTAANQPLYVASGQNSKPIARFDGSNDTLKGTFTLNQPDTVILTFKLRSLGNAGDNDTVFDGSAAEAALQSRVGSPPTLLYAGASLGYVTAAIGNGVYVVASSILNGVSSALYANGGSLASGAAGANNAGGLTIGGSRSGTRCTTADIAECVVMSVAASAGNRGAAETAANAYWAVY